MTTLLPRRLGGFLLAASLLSLWACKQDPQSAMGPQTVLPLSNGSGTAHPAITWAYPTLYVMDINGSHKTAIAAPPSSQNWAYACWSPSGSSIAFWSYDFSGNPDTIKAIDISVNSHGTPVGSNLRTVYGFPNTTNSHSSSGVAWSSTTTTGEIAYTTRDASGTHCGLWVISQSGGTPTNVYTIDTSIDHQRKTLDDPTWSPDDSRLAVVRKDSATRYGLSYTIMIFNTSTWQAVDSIPLSSTIMSLEWSRSGQNKLAFTVVARGSSVSYLYYCNPTTGATPSTNSLANVNFPTWSPNNNSLMYIYSDGSMRKVTAYTNSSSQVSTGSGIPWIKWKR